MPCAKSKQIDMAKQLKEEEPVPFGLYPLTQLAENVRRILKDDTYVEIVQALHLFGVRKMDLSVFPERELRNILDEKTDERKYISEVQRKYTSRMNGR